jgi:hypothetical protein
MKSARIRAHYVDDRLLAAGAPLAITHEWRERDGSIARHVEKVTSPDRPHAYSIVCGRSPVLRRVVLRAESLPRT